MEDAKLIEEEIPRELLILYATETGTSQDCADYIARQCRRIAFQCRVVSMDVYSLPDLISENLVIFVVSTTGSGVEPRAMTALWNKLLRSDLPSDLFEGLPFSVFGLGDTSYEKFCWAAKKLSRRMKTLGATEICGRGEGDEQDPLGVDGALVPWTERLLQTLLELAPLPQPIQLEARQEMPPPRVSLHDSNVTQDDLRKANDPLEADKRYYAATVQANRRITAADWYQDVRHFEFKFEDDIQYSPGDVAVIHPVALDADVTILLDRLGWVDVADKPFKVVREMSDQSLPDYLPETTTLRAIFTRYLDFNAVPRRSFFQYLWYFTPDEVEREKLDEFLAPEGTNELYDYCHKVRRTILEILHDFRHVKIPKDYIFDVFPPLRARHFSIASSVAKHPHEVDLCIAIVKYRTKLKVPRRGVCTSYLSALVPGDRLRIGFLKGLIKLPPDDKTPVICIGPGTGIAPMRALIEDRVERGANANTLYFGCRSAEKDQHYGDEWEKLNAEQKLVYRTAFSRDGPEGVRRTYVQDRILEDAETVWRLAERERAWVYISGSSNKMPIAVKEAIAKAVETYGGRAQEEAKLYVENMAKEGRLIEECWS
ncbi:riboflavin synthase domain-like protein [Coprinopsis marcescibilis]|uniref:NADPH-dependent diflavin oxidoreductase 1 n=1 Tax=Coprinopsis marcescibilis TaxID=230819 RepID=A0A5C3L3I2_COPMA|nr:riboflavin synthase domain-like protein [Coprinopsis marcescibilis]